MLELFIWSALFVRWNSRYPISMTTIWVPAYEDRIVLANLGLFRRIRHYVSPGEIHSVPKINFKDEQMSVFDTAKNMTPPDTSAGSAIHPKLSRR